jgi:hypothetical protein
VIHVGNTKGFKLQLVLSRSGRKVRELKLFVIIRKLRILLVGGNEDQLSGLLRRFRRKWKIASVRATVVHAQLD